MNSSKDEKVINVDPANVESPELKKLLYLSTRENGTITLADVLRYESKTGNMIGSNLTWKLNTQISPNNVIEIFETLYPDFKWNPEETDSPGEINAFFASELAWYSVNRIKDGNTSELNDMFIVSEILLSESSETAHKLVVDFLEDFQTLFFNFNLDTNIIANHIKPETKLWWDEINSFWKAAGNSGS
jgi:hypothetical protein